MSMRYFSCLFVLVITLSSCRSNRIYNKLNSTNHDIYFARKATKYIFDLLADSIKSSKHIIYIFHAVNHLPTVGFKDFSAIIYDPNSRKTYLLRNDSLRAYKAKILPAGKEMTVLAFILENYRKNKIKDINKAQVFNISEGGLGDTYLYDIDTSQKTKMYKWDSILIDEDGNPTKNLMRAVGY